MFDFAIVIDFEATCYGPEEKCPVGWKSEIVEFPAVLIDLTSGEIIEEFHEFVRPTENPEISNFCGKFLHLQDRDLTKSESISEIIQKFNTWVKEISEKHNFENYYPSIKLKKDKICCFVTWTDWDIGLVF